MGLFDFFKKPKTDLEQYYEDRNRREREMRAAGESAQTAGGSDFQITVQDVFTITGRGTVITGRVEAGSVSVGDAVTLRRVDGSERQVIVAGIEMFRKMKDIAVAGENAGILLRQVERKEIGRGDVLLK